MKKRLLTFSMILIVALQGMAAFIGFDPKQGMSYTSPSNVEPTQSVTYSASGINVSYEITAVNMFSDDVFTTAYNAAIPGFGNTNTESQPSYPFKADRFELPEGCENVSVSITDFKFRDKTVTLAPARILIADSEDYTFTTSNIKRIAPTTIGSGNDVVTYNKVVEKDGKKIVEVGLQPIQYHSASANMRVYYDFSYKIEYLDANGTPIEILPVEEDAFLRSLPFSYLILSKSEFSTQCENFAYWKNKQGFTTKVILSDKWTPATIKEAIKEYVIENPFGNLKYVLLVGDHSIIPSNTVYTTVGNELGSTSLTDYYYGCIDSDDDFEQDVYVGRIPASNPAEAEIVLNKIIKYATTVVDNPDFYNNSLHCAHYQIVDQPTLTSRYFVWTSEYIYDYMSSLGYDVARVYKKDSNAIPTNVRNLFSGKTELLPAELRSSSFNWEGKAQDVINNINRGVFYVLHRDHGAYTGWGSPRFSIYDIDNLSNGDKLPVVFSLNCLTGDFSKKCFASKFLTKENGGCVGIFAASNLTYTPLNDYLALGIFNSIWRSGELISSSNQQGYIRPKSVYSLHSLGEILSDGMDFMCSKYGSNSQYYKVSRERFQIFGDPSMLIHTEQPGAYNKHEVDIKKFGLDSARVHIQLNNDEDNVYLAVYGNESARIYFGKNIEYYGDINGKTRFCIYGQNYTLTNISTGIESYPLSDVKFDFALNNNIILLRKVSYFLKRTLTVNIYDTNMSVIKSVQWAPNDTTLQIDTSSLKSGLYILAVLENGHVLKSWNIKI
ncbi:C25 family cysteine peptidase [Bacteroides acidifaciens]|uniref:C25 family cysteine peptidase n=1 Tax=Bacteroides acidifaciens TaxID=85831 RepID=UPI0025A9817C|nr:C25 family cysteine peptidase [Bacteroides acidifaciens]